MDVYIMLDENKIIRGVKQFSIDSPMTIPVPGWSFELVDESIATNWMDTKEDTTHQYIKGSAVITEKALPNRKDILKRKLFMSYKRYVEQTYPPAISVDMLFLYNIAPVAKKVLIDSIAHWKRTILQYYCDKVHEINLLTVGDPPTTWNFHVFDSTDPHVDIRDII